MLRQAIQRSRSHLAAHSTKKSRPSVPPPSFLLRTMSTAPDSSDVPQLKPWPHAVVESRGDYRAEAYLEDHVGGALYARQRALPRLPVPSLAETAARYLPTALPLAASDDERATLSAACAAFEGEAGELQRRLVERQEGEMRDSSWLQSWWNSLGYLQVRDPLVINVSYFFHFSDDATLPPAPSSGASRGVRRAAALLHSTAEFRRRVAAGALAPEALGRKEPRTTLCSTAYKYMFNACRVPRRGDAGGDTYRLYDPAARNHVVVACGGRFYAFDFVAEGGAPLPLPVLEDRLRRCAELAAGTSTSPLPPLGYLTSDDRDACADAREELLRVGGAAMERALEVLESGAVLVCLDENEAPVSKRQTSELLWTGGVGSGHNRWFDKSIQLICTRNGKAGMTGEHSMMDGMPVVRFCDYITQQSYEDVAARSGGAAEAAAGGHASAEESVTDVFAACAPALAAPGSGVAARVAQSKARFDALVSAHEMQVQSFRGYGAGAIKKMGHSPDAYVQMAIQLATYRLWGEQGGTYEATQVRPFLHGRTETTRTVSPASAAFVQAMGPRPGTDAADAKLELLREGVATHVKYIGAAAKGHGVDRHLLGLALSARDGEATPRLFSHPVHGRAKTWRVSTSHLTHPRFDNWGYGEVTPDGVGLAYSIHPGHCVFCVTALREHDWPDRLSELLEEALLEMQALHDLDQAPASRL